MTIVFRNLFGRHRRLLLAGVLLLASAFALGGYRYAHKPPPYKGISRIQIDMRKPEMVLVTHNLAELPKDVAATPALRGLVDEELVFHYEEDEARLSLAGSLRRLAYEHNFELQDHFLATLLASPAEVGIWRSGKGRAEYFVVAIERGTMAKLTEILGKIALDDGQLKLAGNFSVGGKTLPLYTLDYGSGRTLAFLGAGDRWIFISDPALALDANNAMTADAQQVLGELLHGRHPWRDQLPHSAAAKHSLVVAPQVLSLGYSRFMPALTALRLDYKDKAWLPELRLDTKALPEHYDLHAKLAGIWKAAPARAALCAALPIDWKAAEAPLNELLENDPALPQTLNALDPLGAICWYPGSRLSAPLFIAVADKPLTKESSRILASLAEKAWASPGNPLLKDKDESYVAEVASIHGMRTEEGKERGFQPTLARHGQLILFSPDRRHVDAALAVAAKQAPAAADAFKQQDPAWLLYDAKRLAQVVRAEVQEVLPTDEESYFREVARSRLWPRLDAWGQMQVPTAFVLGKSDGDNFYKLDAKNLERSR